MKQPIAHRIPQIIYQFIAKFITRKTAEKWIKLHPHTIRYNIADYK